MEDLFANTQDGVLNIFYTAGYPKLDSTVRIAQALDKAGVKIVEIGMPYSDPLADGETIQQSSEKALANGMNLDIMFSQIDEISKSTKLTVVLMGYLNQMMSVGVEQFLRSCSISGVSGLIIPDLPLVEYEREYEPLFRAYSINISFLVTPRTSLERIKKIDRLSSGFIYLVADNSITGDAIGEFSDSQIAYFKKINSLKLTSPQLIGFGIKTPTQYKICLRYTNGAIIGSEFIRQLTKPGFIEKDGISNFIDTVLDKE